MSSALHKACNLPKVGGNAPSLDESCKLSLRAGSAALNKSHDISSGLTISLDEISAAMNIPTRSLMRKHRKLTHDHGFPPPLPGGVWMWSRSAFEAWVRANGVQDVELDAAEPTVTAANDSVARLVRSQNEAMRARYGGAR